MKIKVYFLNRIISLLLITLIIPGTMSVASAVNEQLGDGGNFDAGNSTTVESREDRSSDLSSSSGLDYNDSEEYYDESEWLDYNDSGEYYNDSEEYFTDDGSYIYDYSSSGLDVLSDLYLMGIDAIEPATNIYAKELAIRNVVGGYPVRFDFVDNATCITDIEFDPMRTFRKTTTTAQVLKDISVFVPEPPTGKIYQHINIWVGCKGAGLPTSLKNGLVGFKVEKAWIKDNNVNESLITLQWYNKSWEPLDTKKVGEDNNYVYFKSKTPGFSCFAITENTGKINKSPFAYVTNYDSNEVSVINTATNRVTATVPVGTGPEGAVVTPDGKKIYVTNYEDDTISVIDTATNNVTSTVGVGSSPWGIIVNPDGKKVYVVNYDSGTTSVIDTATNNVTATVKVGSCPEGIVVNPAGTKVYVANYEDDTISIIDTANNIVTANVTVGDCPSGVAITPDGKKVYVTNYEDNTTSIIDTANNIVTANVTVGNGPSGVAVNPDGKKVYVVNSDSDTTSVIDTATNNVTATIEVGSQLGGVAVTPNGKKVYLANYNSGTVSIIDAATNNITATVNVGNGPSEVAIVKSLDK